MIIKGNFSGVEERGWKLVIGNKDCEWYRSCEYESKLF